MKPQATPRPTALPIKIERTAFDTFRLPETGQCPVATMTNVRETRDMHHHAFGIAQLQSGELAEQIHGFNGSPGAGGLCNP